MSEPSTFDEFREASLFDDGASSRVGAETVRVANEPDIDVEDIDPVEALGDLAHIVDDIFRTWIGDGEEQWAAQAFLCIKRQGLVSDGGYLDHVRNCVLLCTIWALSKEFYARAFEEGYTGDWTYEIPDIIGVHPKLSPLSLGRLAEREEIYAEIDEDVEDPHDVLAELIRHFARPVADALLADLSDTWMLPYLWAARSGDTTYPLPDDHPAWEQLHDPSSGALEAYSWIVDGMPL